MHLFLLSGVVYALIIVVNLFGCGMKKMMEISARIGEGKRQSERHIQSTELTL